MYFYLIFPSDEDYSASEALGLVADNDSDEEKAMDSILLMLADEFGEIKEAEIDHAMREKVKALWKVNFTKTKKFGWAYSARTAPPPTLPKWLFVEKISD